MSSQIPEALVANLFDHAGIFPPTQRPLDEAYKVAANFSSLLKRPEIIATEMVLSIDKLESFSLSHIRELGFPKDRVFRISLLASADLAADLKKIADFNKIPGQRVEALDLKVGETLPQSLTYPTDLRIFFEPDLSIPEWKPLLSKICDQILQTKNPRLGLKCRGTGPTGIANDKMAWALYETAARKLSFKVTGGFHHMVVGEKNSAGFLNFVTAFVLSRAAALRPEELARILNNREVQALGLSPKGLCWGKHEVSREKIQEIRQTKQFSIGCCNPLTPDKELADLE